MMDQMRRARGRALWALWALWASYLGCFCLLLFFFFFFFLRVEYVLYIQYCRAGAVEVVDDGGFIGGEGDGQLEWKRKQKILVSELIDTGLDCEAAVCSESFSLLSGSWCTVQSLHTLSSDY
ncbi:hypothetical protein BO86DRAFT_166168 [Aspergillus japonicus CBS 114.51]|uniref:Uncharacterized protein n=1 Tax=Aspergillus japonicus CBS 114.51 TaxID=1448312 RepID=A0A8T8XD98_ASPJA|nr:hypothetical protein BO86DRAFT_166168 [Aspergillus japonicus CBS 114.51]RAH85784.1 hypothetical protein BO86DRAFT_166168 [Aspergillus japonicus CBS 114.51]